ncbi:MAG TPA: hypothetical protein VLL51_01840, partial [Gemmatimonadales bacterium]|nr:hypothetical protein [Gemmatimonadales bacterium]
MRHLTLPPRSNWWLPATALLAVLGGEWLRTLAPILVVAVVLAALAVILLVPWRRGGPSLLTVAWLAGTIALSISATAHRHSLLAKGVPAETRRQADRAIAETRRRLDRLQQELARVARKAETLPLESREAAFNAAEDLVAEADPAMALGVLGAAGQPVVWAGTHRLPLAAGTQTHAFRHTSFYSVLELRRQRADGGMVVVSALIWADSILANTPPSLIGEIRNDLDVDVLLEKMGPGVAGVPWPADAPVLSIVVPQQDPAGGVARLRRRSGPVVAGLLLGLIGAAVVGTTVPAARFMMLALVPWLVLRAPLDRALGLEAYLSPATFFSPLLGPLSSSTGTLAVTGGLLLVLAVAAWHRRPPRTAGSLLLAVVLLVAAPYLLREFGRGITPPAAGVPAWLWLTWHFTLMVTAAAMLAAAAALLRGREPARRSWPTLLGALLGIAAAGVGVLAYTGRPAWPTWYTALWLPGILLAARPASRRVTILAVGCIAGAGATLMTWGAAITGRTDVAVRDINSLGSTRDPVVEPLLIGFATRLGEDPPTEPAALFRAWRRSPLWRDGLPVRLTVWEAGRPGVDVVLNRLSVDDSVLAALAARVTDSSGPLLTAVSVSPGVHYVVAVRADSARTLTVTVGPRSQLVPAAPLGRTLEVAPQRTPLYRLAMAGLPPGQEAPRRTGWRREGWALRTTRPVVVDGHPLEVNALIALGRPGSLFVRGGLLLLLDVALVWVLWVVAERISGIPWRPPDFRRVVASYQGRLAIALSVFFVTPAAVLAGVS